MDKRRFLLTGTSLALLGATGCTTTSPSRDEPDVREHRRDLTHAAGEALARLHDQVPGSRELTDKARAVLVFPRVLSGGLVVGGSYGEGRLSGSRLAPAYYKVASGSVGLLAGAQSRAMFLLFMTQDSLDRFILGSGWTIGVDASVALAKLGANGQLDTASAQAPVVAFVLTNAGLMADLSLTGTRFMKSES